MSLIRPGDCLACIEDDAVEVSRIYAGRVYTCVDVLPEDYLRQQGYVCTSNHADCGGGVQVREASAGDCWWCAASFRPIYRPKESWERRIKNLVPA